MRALVVYESMFGNTHEIADRVAAGLRGGGEVVVVPVAGATPEVVAGADLVVVGGPTHVHGMASPRTRDAAHKQADESDGALAMEPDAEGPGLREWFDAVHLPEGCRAAAFDTRAHGPAMLTGRASKGIAKRLEAHGAAMIAEPESFLVDKENHLDAGEEERAESWGAALAARL